VVVILQRECHWHIELKRQRNALTAFASLVTDSLRLIADVNWPSDRHSSWSDVCVHACTCSCIDFCHWTLRIQG